MFHRKLILLLPLLVGCTHPATYSTIYLPDGSNGGIITCHYRSECFHLATKSCGGGAYSVVSGENNQTHPLDADVDVSGDLVPTDQFNPARSGSEYVVRCNQHRGDGT